MEAHKNRDNIQAKPGLGIYSIYSKEIFGPGMIQSALDFTKWMHHMRGILSIIIKLDGIA